MLVRLGENLSLCFCDILGNCQHKCMQGCRGDGEILGARSGGKDSDEGQLFQPISATLSTLSTRPRACSPLSLSLSLSLLPSLFLCVCARTCVTMCPVCHFSPKCSSETKGTSHSSALIIRRLLPSIIALATYTHESRVSIDVYVCMRA